MQNRKAEHGAGDTIRFSHLFSRGVWDWERRGADYKHKTSILINNSLWAQAPSVDKPSPRSP